MTLCDVMLLVFHWTEKERFWNSSWIFGHKRLSHLPSSKNLLVFNVLVRGCPDLSRPLNDWWNRKFCSQAENITGEFHIGLWSKAEAQLDHATGRWYKWTVNCCDKSSSCLKRLRCGWIITNPQGKGVQKVHCWQMMNYSYSHRVEGKLIIENTGC